MQPAVCYTVNPSASFSSSSSSISLLEDPNEFQGWFCTPHSCITVVGSKKATTARSKCFIDFIQ